MKKDLCSPCAVKSKQRSAWLNFAYKLYFPNYSILNNDGAARLLNSALSNKPKE